MMQIHLSKSLVKKLSGHVQSPRNVDRRALQWYAHHVNIADCDCIIIMEKQSRYALVFCDLDEHDFDRFPELFKERLWRETALIAQLDAPLADEDLAFLIELTVALGQKQNYQPGSDRSVMSHMLQVKEHLEYLVYVEGCDLPVSHDDAVSFGLLTNDTLRKRKEDNEYFVPLEVFRRFWLGLLDHVARAPVSKDSPNLIDTKRKSYLAPNVIAVDFSRGRG